ncbi:MAG: MFS transporter [Pseudomonadales bacterium]
MAGFSNALILFAVVATVLLWLTVAFTRERIQPVAERGLSVADSLRAVFGNGPLLVVMVLFTCGMLSFTVRQTVTVYYFKYNLGRADLVALFFGITMPVMLAALAAVPALSARFGKAGAIVVGAVVTLVGCIGLYFTPYDAIVWVFAWSCIVALGGTPIAVLGWAMIPDTVEYAQLRHGHRADGAIFAFASFFQKLAKALGGAGVAGALALASYTPNVAQTPQALAMIHHLMTLVPAAIMLVMIVAARAYRLDKTAHEEILARLQ